MKLKSFWERDYFEDNNSMDIGLSSYTSVDSDSLNPPELQVVDYEVPPLAEIYQLNITPIYFAIALDETMQNIEHSPSFDKIGYVSYTRMIFSRILDSDRNQLNLGQGVVKINIDENGKYRLTMNITAISNICLNRNPKFKLFYLEFMTFDSELYENISHKASFWEFQEFPVIFMEQFKKEKLPDSDPTQTDISDDAFTSYSRLNKKLIINYQTKTKTTTLSKNFNKRENG